MKKLAVVIFAAGRGTRMKSDLPKVLHPVLGLPMIEYPLRVARALRPEKIVVVTGQGAEEVSEIARRGGAEPVVQKAQRGTGDALKVAAGVLKKFSGTVLVLNGDMPLVTAEALKRLLTHHRTGGFGLTLGTFEPKQPGAYGRIVRDNLGRIVRIVEHKDATEGQKSIREVNGGVYVLETEEMGHLRGLKPSPASGEYYVTDLVGAVCASGGTVGGLDLGEDDLLGINSRRELADAAARLRDRIVQNWMDRGVSFLDPGSVWVGPGVALGRDSVIYPNVVLEGGCRVGPRCVIYPNTRIRESRIGAGAMILDGTVVEESQVEAGARIGPMAHLRPGSRVGAEARVGNFVELKKTVLGKGAKASHLTYLGDTRVGAGANIGAGTITCNYDGERKHPTVIAAGAFIGSDSQLVAPVTVGKGAYVGAGTTVTEDVPPGALAVSRTVQTTVRGWAAKRRRMKKPRGV